MNAAGELEFVDAHHHLQDYEHDRYPWLASGKMGGALSPDISPLRRIDAVRDLRADLAGVTLIKSVDIQRQRERGRAIDMAVAAGPCRWQAPDMRPGRQGRRPGYRRGRLQAPQLRA